MSGAFFVFYFLIIGKELQSDDSLRALLSRIRRIAVVGYSANPARPSHYVSAFLAECGYEVIPVNPSLAGRVFLGRRACGSLSEVGGPVDMVDVFRRTDFIPGVVDDALASMPGLGTIWMQLGLRHENAARHARAAGMDVVQDRCPKIEIPRLFGPRWRVT